MTEGPPELALFDLDHTLLDGDSNTLWLDYLVDHGHIPPETRQTQAEHMASYAAERLDIEAYLGFHLGLLAGRPLSDWMPILERFIVERILPRISFAARNAVAEHRRKGHRTVIVTATHAFLSSAIAGFFGLPVIAPRGEIRDGRLTGRIDGPVCFREKKLTCLNLWLEKEGLNSQAFGRRHFYTDSANDLPMLESVSHPVVVNPDPRLAEIAIQRNWPVLAWRASAATRIAPGGA